MGTINLHYDGEFVVNNKISLMVLSRSLDGMQSALNRAYLDLKYKDGVWKWAKLPSQDYNNVQYYISEIKGGSFQIKFERSLQWGNELIDRLRGAIDPIYSASEKGVENSLKIRTAVLDKRKLYEVGALSSTPFEVFRDTFNKDAEKRKFGDRSIAKEIDQAVSVVRPKSVGESKLQLTLEGSQRNDYLFDRAKSIAFHSAVSARSLGDPVIYTGKLESLDRRTNKGKFVNFETKRPSILHFEDEPMLQLVRDYLGRESVTFLGAPLFEYSSYDPNSGDIYFLKLL